MKYLVQIKENIGSCDQRVVEEYLFHRFDPAVQYFEAQAKRVETGATDLCVTWPVSVADDYQILRSSNSGSTASALMNRGD